MLCDCPALGCWYWLHARAGTASLSSLCLWGAAVGGHSSHHFPRMGRLWVMFSAGAVLHRAALVELNSRSRTGAQLAHSWAVAARAESAAEALLIIAVFSLTVHWNQPVECVLVKLYLCLSHRNDLLDSNCNDSVISPPHPPSPIKCTRVTWLQLSSQWRVPFFSSVWAIKVPVCILCYSPCKSCLHCFLFFSFYGNQFYLPVWACPQL